MVEFQRRAKHARLVRKECQSENGVSTRSRSTNNDNVWARAPRRPQLHSQCVAKEKTHNRKPNHSMQHGFGISKNEIAKKVLKKAHKINKGVGTRNSFSGTQYPLRRSLRTKRPSKLERNKLFETENTKGRQKCCREPAGELNFNSRSSSHFSTKTDEFDRVVLVKLNRLSSEEILQKHPIDRIFKRKRRRPPLSSKGSSKALLIRRKYQRRSKILEEPQVKRKRGRPPLPKSSDFPTKVRKSVTRKYRRKQRVYGGKPKLSVIELIVAALKEEPKEKRVTEIYRWITNHYSYFRQDDRSWKNVVRHNLSMCKFFEQCEKRPEGGSAPWKLNLQHTVKRKYRRTSSRYLQSIPKLANKSNSDTTASVCSTKKPIPTGQQFIEQVLYHYARKHNVTRFRGSSSQSTSELESAVIQESLKLGSVDETYCTKSSVVPTHAGLAYQDSGEFEISATDQTYENTDTVSVHERLEWADSEESSFFGDGISMQKLIPIDYGDEPPEFERMYENIHNSDVPLLKIGSFEFAMYGEKSLQIYS